MQGEQAMIRADDRDDVQEPQGFDNLQTPEDIAEFEAWLDGIEVVPVEYMTPEGWKAIEGGEEIK